MKTCIAYCGLDCEALCPIRRCALAKGLETCGACPEMARCQKLAPIIQNNPAARENLKGE